MKKRYFLVVLAASLLCISKTEAQDVVYPSTPGVVWPNVPFGGAFNGVTTGIFESNNAPDLICASHVLVGYVNFQYAGTASPAPSRWNIDDITCYGPATQRIYIGNPGSVPYAATGSVYNTNNYCIVKNPQSMNGAGTFQDINAPGGFFVTHASDVTNALVYTIQGLNSPLLTYGLNGDIPNGSMPAGLIYYVRIRVHNFGTQNGCNYVGNNIVVKFNTPSGSAYSQGDLFYDRNLNRGTNGRWMSQSPICSGNNQRNMGWGGDGQVNPNPVGYNGNTATLEGCFAVGAGKGMFAANDGFQIVIGTPSRNGNNLYGIESIEVYGCLPMKVVAKDRDDEVAQNFCQSGAVNLSAEGAGFGSSVTWYKGDTWAQAFAAGSVGSGRNISVTAPSVVGASATYWAEGEYGKQSITIHSVFCCSAVGEVNEVFRETFPFFTPTTNMENGATITPLNPANGTTTYTYIMNNGQSDGHGSNTYHLDEGEYAITNHSHWCFWGSRTQVNEHTGLPGSGAMMVNAGSNTNAYFYERQMTGLCPNTQYEFSAWYASIANPSEGPSNIMFEIRDGSNALIKQEATGRFGGNCSSGGCNDSNSSFIWRKKTITFNTGSATSYWAKLRNTEGATSGNDLMIDDIMVTKCIPTLYVYEHGTINSSLAVCSSDHVVISVELDAATVALICGGGTIVYAQLMSSTDNHTWTAVSPNGMQTVTGSGYALFTITPPATSGQTVYYRVKLSVIQSNAANVNLSLTATCYNDVITQTFDIIRDGNMGNANNPTNTPHYICNNTYTDYRTLVGFASNDATLWGWVLNTPDNVIFNNDADTTVTQNGTWYFVYKNNDCNAYKTVVISDISTGAGIDPITISQPAAVCEGSSLNLTAPTISSPVTAQGWLLNGTPFTYGSTVTMADNGKTLKYFARNACDTVESNGVTLRVGQKYNIPINQQWCAGQRYNQNGFDVTPTQIGVQTYPPKNLTTTLGCDSIVTLTLDVRATLNETVYDTICSAQLPYTWRGHNYPLGTTGGSFPYQGTSAGGCDSTVTHNLTVYSSDNTQDTKDVCAFDLPYTYNVFGRDTIFGVNTTSGDFVFRTRCSMHTLHLNIAPKVNAGNPVFSIPICVGDRSFTITIPPAPNATANDVLPTHFKIEFASSTGIPSPQTGALATDGTFEVTIPSNLYPEYYSSTITLTSGAGCNELVFNNDNGKFPVYYPNSIMQQKWNNVISLLNYNYNGGYQFSGYQWYENGNEMVGKTDSYIYLGKDVPFVIGTKYSVLITRPDGSQMFSCPLVATAQAPQTSNVPIIVSGNGNITIHFPSPKKVTANIYSVTGILIGSANLEGEIVTMIAPPQGTYLLEIISKDNNMGRQIFPFVSR